jgi:hypothetical protein
MINPSVDNMTMNIHPSARPQTSSILATGMYRAEVMALETTWITVKRE